MPADFSKIYGSTATGGLTPISDVDYAKGWEFVGSNPPTKNDFSYLQNLSDLKSQWLYSNKLQRTDPFGDIKSDGTVSQALSNLGLGNLPTFGAAASKGVASNADMQTGTSTDLLTTVAAVMSIFSKRSFAQNDFIRIPDVPGGLIIQWGLATNLATGVNFSTVPFPTPFPNAALIVVPVRAYQYAATGAQANPTIRQITKNNFDINIGDATNVGAYWIAIGY